MGACAEVRFRFDQVESQGKGFHAKGAKKGRVARQKLPKVVLLLALLAIAPQWLRGSAFQHPVASPTGEAANWTLKRVQGDGEGVSSCEPTGQIHVPANPRQIPRVPANPAEQGVGRRG